MSSPYASLETYAAEYYEQHYRQADTAGRDVRRARRVLGRPNVHEERPRRVAPTPPRRRAPSRAEAQTGAEFSGGRGLAQERPVPGAVMDHQRQPVPIRTPTDHLTNGFGSREAARVVRCRVRTGAPDGRAGRPRAGEDEVRCAARVAWAAAQPFRGSRTCLTGHARQTGRSRRQGRFRGRAAHRERRGQPPKLAWTWPGVRTLLFLLGARACDRFPVR